MASLSGRFDRARNGLAWLLTIVALIVWAIFLRPPFVGGSTHYVIVRGHSMVPTYHPTDLLLLRPSRAYHTGDVVAYKIPKDQPGAGFLVTHRIVGGSAAHGFESQGDNVPRPDYWRFGPRDIKGKLWMRVPRLGAGLLFLRAPLPLAALAAIFSAYFAYSPRPRTP